MNKLAFVAVALLAVGLTGTPVTAGTFATNPGDPGNTVTFEISAPLETIVGTTGGAVKGHFDFNPQNIKASKMGMFVIDVASFETGIDLRDEHFRDNFLHTSKFPTATFTMSKVAKVSSKSVKAGESANLEIEGTLDMHGVQRSQKVAATVTYMDDEMVTDSVLPGNVIAVKANFRVALADYQIERPEMLVLKVGEVVDIDVIMRLTDSPKTMNACGCGDCGGCGG
jgi:polyisoprenoid-binding protein YceI